jgi:hypothetical protein
MIVLFNKNISFQIMLVWAKLTIDDIRFSR